jgi:hypothetical protein
MKLHPVNLMIAVAVSALVAYGFWSIDGPLKAFVAVGSFVFLVGTLAPAIGIDYALARRAVNLKIVCGAFFFLGVAINVLFSFLSLSQVAYILVSAIAFLVYMALANAIYSARQ